MLPGHVCTITGRKSFDFIATEYHIPAVISGFESTDIIQSIYLLLKQISISIPSTQIAYTRLVSEYGNTKAQEIVSELFEPVDAKWRGFGIIPMSGMQLKAQYKQYDTLKRFSVNVPQSALPEGCSCGEVLRGKFKPPDCPLFGAACTPSTPVGPCMVSSEGSCAAHYLYY
jgi:hydrogenase expression/formation protein HypD